MKTFFFKDFKQMTVKPLMLAMAIIIAVSVFLMAPLSAHAAQNEFPMETPLWVGPYDIFINPELNIAFPDLGAAYWSAKITIPEGAILELDGKYAHARYLSINSYDMETASPTDALNDTQIAPDPGSENPFLPGALRTTVYNRDFTITILNELPPEDPAQRMPNTLYAKAGDEGNVALVWRLYVIDKNRDITGGIGLPEPRVILASGDVLEGQAAYDALDIDHTMLDIVLLPPGLYPTLRSGQVWGLDIFNVLGMATPENPYPVIPEIVPGLVSPAPTNLVAFPAQNPPDVRKTFDINYTIMAWYLGFNLDLLTGSPPYKGAQYANLDNQYLTVLLSREYGEIAVIRGKAPVTPHTYQRAPFMDGDVDMRYWSVTTNESLATTSVVDGTYDEQIPLDDNGFYTIVVSLADDRPSNSYERYGVKWLNWGEAGDGAGNLSDGHLLFRHMLPSPDFGHAIQDIQEVGTEADVLGEYMPEVQYMSTEEFEALGRRPCENSPWPKHSRHSRHSRHLGAGH